MRTDKMFLGGVLAIAAMSAAANASVLLPNYGSNGGNGVIGTVTATDVDSTTQLRPSVSTSAEKHGVVEIGIASIASGSIINSASFVFDLTGVSGSANSNSTLEIYGYVGNGSLSAADFSPADAVLLATLTPSGNDKHFEVDVTGLLQSLVSSGSSYIGFMAKDTGDGSPNSSYSFSTNYSQSASNYGPNLVVDYTSGGTGTPPVPEPASLGIAAIAGGALLLRRRK